MLCAYLRAVVERDFVTQLGAITPDGVRGQEREIAHDVARLRVAEARTMLLEPRRVMEQMIEQESITFCRRIIRRIDKLRVTSHQLARSPTEVLRVTRFMEKR